MKRRMRHMMLAGLLAGLLAGPARGSVFRVGGNALGRLNTVGLPWDLIYQTTMTVNGRRNEVQVYAARNSEPVAEQFKMQFEQQGATVKLGKSADGGAMGFARWDRGEARMLVLTPGDRPDNLVFLFYPELGVAREPESPVTVYPGGTITQTVMNEDTQAFCTTLTTLDSVSQVQRFYAESLGNEGWRPVLPLKMSNGMSFFHKKESTCCVLARSNASGETMVTVLVRDKSFW
jgi:hypothetical protein